MIIRKEHLPHIAEPGKGQREQFAHYILPVLQDPLEVWLAEHEVITPSGRTKKERIQLISATLEFINWLMFSGFC